MGAKHGIMFKTAVSLEETGKIQIVALDKTGTITSGEPRGNRHSSRWRLYRRRALLAMACALEKKSEHPLARAILATGTGAGALTAAKSTDFQARSRQRPHR